MKDSIVLEISLEKVSRNKAILPLEKLKKKERKKMENGENGGDIPSGMASFDDVTSDGTVRKLK